MLGIARASADRARRDAPGISACCCSTTTPCSPPATSSAPAPEAPRGFTAESQRARAELAAAASRGGFAEGETVHVGWRMLDLDAVARGEASGPLAWRDGVPSVRWSAAGGCVPLAAYLDERIALLLDPPHRSVTPGAVNPVPGGRRDSIA